ncbi:MAG: N-acetylmuramoyl-L-alanine amidase [Bacteroidales bacterium]|nr:N-acetylmuramoyl-L-alanine amidase [Bacteroidales bacterium]
MKKIFTILSVVAMAFTLNATSTWSGLRIMLDPGHGGHDCGACGYNSQKPHEADLVLLCSNTLYPKLTALGAPVSRTRLDDTFIALQTRKALSVSYDPYIFCSIHLNASTAHTASGTETWYYWTTGNSLNLANKVQAQLLEQMGRTNRGVQRNGWTVITGSASVPAILTEGEFVDNQSAWNYLKDETGTGFANWVKGHLYGFYDHFNQTLGKDITNPKTTSTDPTPTTNPTLKVSTTSLYFDARRGSTETLSFTVTGTDLSGNITVTSSNSMFTVDNATLGSSGGTVKVKFTPPTDASTMAAGDFSGYKITVKNTTDGTSYSKTVKITGHLGEKLLTNLSKQWRRCQAAGNVDKTISASVFGYDPTLIRNFAYYQGKLYCVYNGTDILVLNALNGYKIGFLKKGTTILESTLQLCDVKVLDGVIFACSLAINGTDKGLRIYQWDSDDSYPKRIYTTTNFRDCDRLGDCMEVTGDVNGTLYFTFANDNSEIASSPKTQILQYIRKMKDSSTGVADSAVWSLWRAPVYRNDGSTQLSTKGNTRAYRLSGKKWWIDGKDSYPTLVKANDDETAAISQNITIDTGESWGSSFHDFTWGDDHYVANIVFNGKVYDKNGNMVSDYNYKGARVRLSLDAEKDYSRVYQVKDYPNDTIGLGIDSRNTNATADLVIDTDSQNYVWIWEYSTTHGIGCYGYGTLPTYTLPSSITPDAAITISDTDVILDTEVGKSASTGITVSGTDLVGDITISLGGTDKGMFSIDTKKITQANAQGVVVVTYTPTEAGTHTATLTIKSTQVASQTVTIVGTATESDIPDPDYQFVDLIPSLTEGWCYSVNRGNLAQAPWFSSESPWSRSIEVINGHLYVLNHQNWGTDPVINIVDAYTGTQLGTLSTEGVNDVSCAAKLSSLSKIGNQLIACNYASATHTLTVYKWASDTSDPEIILQDSAHGGAYVGMITASGTMSDGYLWFCSPAICSVIRYKISNGDVNSTPEVIKLANEWTIWGNFANVYPDDNDTFWVACDKMQPVRYNNKGEVVETLPVAALGSAVAPSAGTDVVIVPFGERKYMGAVTYAGSNANGLNSGALALIDLTSGAEAATAPVGVYPSDGYASDLRNTNFISSVAAELTDKNTTINLWTLVPQQGVAYYYYQGLIASGIESEWAQPWQLVTRACQVSTTAPVALIEVYTLSGSMVKSSHGEPIDCSSLPAGVYIARAIGLDRHTQVAKITVAKR